MANHIDLALNTPALVSTSYYFYSTYTPPADANAQTLVVCDDDSNPIGVNKPIWRLYDYNYNLHLMEERYNILIFESGNAGLMFSR